MKEYSGFVLRKEKKKIASRIDSKNEKFLIKNRICHCELALRANVAATYSITRSI